jgi:hypothetical protein
MDILPIKSQRDHRKVLKEIEGLMMAKRHTLKVIASTCLSRWWKPGSGSIIQCARGGDKVFHWSGSDLRPRRIVSGGDAAYSAFDIPAAFADTAFPKEMRRFTALPGSSCRFQRARD